MSRTFTFDGKPVPFKDGDTLGSALHRAGHRVLSRSFKYHRPRGLYCVTGSCASCFVAVDGAPNLPACMEPARAGAVVASQNRIGSVKRDLLGVVDHVYRKGFDPHGAFTKIRPVNELFNKSVRFMSGIGKAPTEPPELPRPPRRHQIEVDEIVIGAGRQGLARAAKASGDVLVVDELPGLGGSLQWDPLEAETAKAAKKVAGRTRVTCWTEALAFGIYDGVVAVAKDGDLYEVQAGRITVATGRHDGQALFPGNDLPGVLSLRGATRLLRQHHVLPGTRIVGHGAPLPRDFVADLEAADGQVVAEGEVAEARGGRTVEAAVVDGAKVACDTVVVNVPGTPRIELLQQAGCELTFNNPYGGLGPKVTKDGRTTTKGVYAAFPEVS